MDNINIDLHKALMFLVEGKIVKEDVLPKTDSQFSSEILIKEIEKGSELSYDALNDELYIVKEDGEMIICPDLSEGMSTSVEWISDYLPEVFFDTHQGGNARKSDEADSAYKLICIGRTIREYQEEIIDFFKKYDYLVMAGIEGSGVISFRECLQKMQNLNSVRINSIISAAAYKLSIFKEKNELFYIGLLKPEETSGLSSLSRNIKAVITKYEQEEGLNPIEMSTMTKISKLQKIDKRDLEIQKLIEESPYAMFYKILKLNSERIPPVTKSRILAEAEKGGRDYVIEHDIKPQEREDYKAKVMKTIVRESYRAVLRSIIEKDISRYRSDPDNFKFKAKS